MKNELMLFENMEFGKVRVEVINEEPWFVGRDVAECLGYSEPRSAVSKKWIRRIRVLLKWKHLAEFKK